MTDSAEIPNLIRDWLNAVETHSKAEKMVEDARQKLGDALTPEICEDGETFHMPFNHGVLTVKVSVKVLLDVVLKKTYCISWAERP